jgi:hypothetical protein
LQGIVIAVDFLAFRWRSGICLQERFSRASFAKFAHSTPRRAVARAASCVMRNRLAAGLTVELASSGVRAGFVTPPCLRQRGHGRTSPRGMLSIVKILTSNGAFQRWRRRIPIVFMYLMRRRGLKRRELFRGPCGD